MSRKINAIIVDDEIHCLETLSWQLKKFCPDVEVIATCSSGEDALDVISGGAVDLVFLDIEMPRMNGFEMLQRLKEVTFEIIFTTAYDAFAVKAFKFSALDYLLKPIDKEELLSAVDKLRHKRNFPISEDQINILFQSLHAAPRGLPKVALPTMEGLEFILVDEIIHCQSDSNYTNIFLKDKRKLLISRTLKEIEEMLADYHFLRVHHSHLINLNHVKKYVKGDGGYVIMIDNSIVNVSRNRKDELMKAFN